MAGGNLAIMKIKVLFPDSNIARTIEVTNYKVTDGGVLICTPADGLRVTYAPSAWRSVTETEKRRSMVV
ncbi:hypothetical protein [Serinicoccus sediminis]|uniref:hypothetical protein n=1 Tax=Serinicoccus sediminis TaxID=2306021 RepID=UPI0010219D25|nr:hypothetical protein [Serinicoccus sediminis]